MLTFSHEQVAHFEAQALQQFVEKMQAHCRDFIPGPLQNATDDERKAMVEYGIYPSSLGMLFSAGVKNALGKTNDCRSSILHQNHLT